MSPRRQRAIHAPAEYRRYPPTAEFSKRNGARYGRWLSCQCHRTLHHLFGRVRRTHSIEHRRLRAIKGPCRPCRSARSRAIEAISGSTRPAPKPAWRRLQYRPVLLALPGAMISIAPSSRRLIYDVACYDVTLDLVGALDDLEHLGVPEVSVNGILVGNACRPE
jgi:hypothetical protein